jgi:hypothetical protein
MISSLFRHHTRTLLGVLLLTGAPAIVMAIEPTLSPAGQRLKADVSYLADDLREGRAPGTNGIEAAADHIASVFRELGLKTAPGAEGYFQPFEIGGNPTLDAKASLAIKLKDSTLEGKIRTDFSPLSLGGSADLKNIPVVFVGYGITAKDKDKKLDYDDYAGIDVKDKAVLFIRREPQQSDPKSPFDGKDVSQYSALIYKVTNAFEHKAKAIFIVSDAATAKERDNLLPLTYSGGEQASSVPVVMLTRVTADKMLEAAGSPKLEELEKQIDTDLKPRSKELKYVDVTTSFTIDRKKIKTKNVIAVLEGSGPLADETIFVGGHYDHLGRGGMRSGSLAFLSNDIHNGADDNASGTSMVLEMARRLAKRPEPLPRRVVFMAFSGEEKGLLGSMHYVNHPLYPIDKTVFMVNFDMVGRLNAKSELTLFGIGSTPGAAELVDALGSSLGFTIKKVKGMSDGVGGSDHQSFYMKNVPVLFAFTGLHSEYHRPADDSHLINYDGMSRIADFGELLMLDLVRRPKRPEFTKSSAPVAAHGTGTPATPAKPGEKPTEDTARVSITAYFGSIPDYDDSAKGVKLSGVSPGGPAEKAGLKSGDTIIGFGKNTIATIYDYTSAIGKYKPGDVVDVKITRDGKEMTLKVTLTTRPGR